MTTEKLDELRNELSVKSKNGIDFTLAASILWLIIAYLWTLKFNSYDKSIFVFIVGAPLLPMAFLFSKLLKTNWKITHNPLQPLGLWLNFAQLFYFPFLVLTMIKMPDYFILVYAIITGGHLFPYAWFYKTKWYAIFSGIIVLGTLLLGLYLPNEKMYLIAVCTSISLFVLTICLYFDTTKKLKSQSVVGVTDHGGPPPLVSHERLKW
ncbi:MAG TPA: hypothetical protein VIJ95_10825 [Hanamia sp.]